MSDDPNTSPPLDPRRPDDADPSTSGATTDPEGAVDAIEDRIVPDRPDTDETDDSPAFELDIDPEDQATAAAGDEPTA